MSDVPLVKPEKANVAAKFTAPMVTAYLTKDGQVIVSRRIGRPIGGPVAGASAEVSSSGAVGARSTTTRGLLGGGKLGQKKIDSREVYLLLTGVGWSAAEKIDPLLTKKARAFAVAVNAAAAAAAAAGAQAPGTSRGGRSDAELLTELANLRDAGVLSDEEFDAKKTEILERM